jgi:hypothetical protein
MTWCHGDAVVRIKCVLITLIGHQLAARARGADSERCLRVAPDQAGYLPVISPAKTAVPDANRTAATTKPADPYAAPRPDNESI